MLAVACNRRHTTAHQLLATTRADTGKGIGRRQSHAWQSSDARHSLAPSKAPLGYRSGCSVALDDGVDQLAPGGTLSASLAVECMCGTLHQLASRPCRCAAFITSMGCSRGAHAPRRIFVPIKWPLSRRLAPHCRQPHHGSTAVEAGHTPVPESGRPRRHIRPDPFGTCQRARAPGPRWGS